MSLPNASSESLNWLRSSTGVTPRFWKLAWKAFRIILERKRTPLIIYEVHLRRKYHKKSSLKQSVG